MTLDLARSSRRRHRQPRRRVQGGPSCLRSHAPTHRRGAHGATSCSVSGGHGRALRSRSAMERSGRCGGSGPTASTWLDTGRDGYLFAKLDTGMTEVTRPSLYGASTPSKRRSSRRGAPGRVGFVGPCWNPATPDPRPVRPGGPGARYGCHARRLEISCDRRRRAYCASMSTITKLYPQAPRYARARRLPPSSPGRQTPDQIWPRGRPTETETPAMTTATAQPIVGPEAWRGAELARSTDWIRPLSGAAIDELDVALRAVERRGLGWREITREDFPLSTLSAELARVSDELEHGRGIVLLRGLPVAGYTDSQLLGSTVASAPISHRALPDRRGELIGGARLGRSTRIQEARRQGGGPMAPGRRGPGALERPSASAPTAPTWRALLCVGGPGGGPEQVASSVAVHTRSSPPPDLHASLQEYHRTAKERGACCETAPSHALFALATGAHQSYSRTFVERPSGAAVPRPPGPDEALDLLAPSRGALHRDALERGNHSSTTTSSTQRAPPTIRSCARPYRALRSGSRCRIADPSRRFRGAVAPLPRALRGGIQRRIDPSLRPKG